LKYGVCHLGVIPLRKENDHKSELTSQLLYGDSFKIIDQRKDLYKIRLDWDKYEGWITQNQAIIIEEKEHKLLHEQPFSASKHLIDFVHLANEQIFPIPLGSDLRALSLLGHSIEYTPTILSSKKEAIVQTAYQFLHAPYLWGGKTPMGIDCSGLTQMVYKIHGVPLKRDAYQQAQQGTSLSFIEESQPGDLAFFDNKEGDITHVGILLQNHFILHAHGKVRIDRIDQTGIFNAELQTHSHKLRLIKSIL
jgi:hypothetical protein